MPPIKDKSDVWYAKTGVMSCELRVACYKLEA